MVAVGMLLVWAGYGSGLFGWCLWSDYDLTFGQLLSPVHPYTGPWPPAKIPAGQTWPGGKATAATGGGTATASGSKAATAAKAGAGSAGIIQKITQYLPGFGFIK